MTYVEQINLTRVPKHIAIIMDGNGRWAERHGVPRSEGHRAGAGAVKGDGQRQRRAAARDGQRGALTGGVAAQRTAQRIAGGDSRVVDGGDDVARLQAGLLGAAAAVDGIDIRAVRHVVVLRGARRDGLQRDAKLSAVSHGAVFHQVVCDGHGVIDRDVALMGLKRMDVDALGLDELDRSVLRAIIEMYNGGPVGLETLAAALGEEAVTLEDL